MLEAMSIVAHLANGKKPANSSGDFGHIVVDVHRETKQCLRMVILQQYELKPQLPKRFSVKVGESDD